MDDVTEPLDGYMAAHPKARVAIRGPVHEERLWWVSLTDEDGDAHDFTGPSLRDALAEFNAWRAA